jgi:hypothetical protein
MYALDSLPGAPCGADRSPRPTPLGSVSVPYRAAALGVVAVLLVGLVPEPWMRLVRRRVDEPTAMDRAVGEARLPVAGYPETVGQLSGASRTRRRISPRRRHVGAGAGPDGSARRRSRAGRDWSASAGRRCPQTRELVFHLGLPDVGDRGRLQPRRAADRPLASASASLRRWAHYLRLQRTNYLHREGWQNKYLVDAVAVLEMQRTGLRSRRRGTVLGSRRAFARHRVLRPINRVIPAMAAGRRGFVLSDETAH